MAKLRANMKFDVQVWGSYYENLRLGVDWYSTINNHSWTVGDRLHMIEMDTPGGTPTGRWTNARVRYIAWHPYGAPNNSCILYLDQMENSPE